MIRPRCLVLIAVALLAAVHAGGAAAAPTEPFPRPLDSYGALSAGSVVETLRARAAAEPFNLVATAIFALAVLHTFAAGRFRHWAHVVEERQRARRKSRAVAAGDPADGPRSEVSFRGQALHFLGEVEAVFGIWVIVLAGATILTAFNDNALITYLATLVPGLSEELKYAVVAGAVTGGGLTVIANAPNPAGQSILQKHFDNGVSPLGLLLGAALPTAVVVFAFLVL